MENSKPKNKKEGFIPVGWGLAARPDITPSQKLLYSIVKSLNQGGRKCYASDAKLAKMIGLTTARSVQSSLKKLEDKGLIKRHTRNGRRFLTLGNSIPPPVEFEFALDGNEIPDDIEADFVELYKKN